MDAHPTVSRMDGQPTPGGVSPYNYNTVDAHSYLELGNNSKQDFSPMINEGFTPNQQQKHIDIQKNLEKKYSEKIDQKQNDNNNKNSNNDKLTKLENKHSEIRSKL